VKIRRSAVVVAVCAAVLGGAAASVGQSAQSSSGPVTDWRIVWSDEFSGTSLDTSKWGTCFPADRWTPDNCVVDGTGDAEPASSEGAKIEVGGGTLRLWAEARPITSSKTPSKTYPYRGAMVQARRALSAPNADVNAWETAPVADLSLWNSIYMEARVKIPRGVGLWPAFWAMPANNQIGPWPYSGELDPMEFLPDSSTQGPGGDAKFVTNLVWHGQYRGADCTYRGNGYFTMCPNRHTVSAEPWNGFHTFGVEKGPSGVGFWIDGKMVRFIPRWASSGDDVYPFDQAFFPILRITVGKPPNYLDAQPGTWPIQSPVPAGVMEVDYVRVYQRLTTFGGPTDLPPTPTTTAPPPTTPTNTIPPPSAVCATDTFDGGVGAWSPWYTGSLSITGAGYSGNALALNGTAGTMSALRRVTECGGRPRQIRFRIRSASPSAKFHLKFIDQVTGAQQIMGWYPVDGNWTEITIPINVTFGGLAVGIEGQSPLSPGLFVDSVTFTS
jgi:beta-glucanase (GH16 family)